MKVIIATMVWKRKHVFEIWAQAARDLIMANKKINIQVVCCGSCPEDREMVLEAGFTYVHAPNVPLGRKAQRRLMACKGMQPDRILFLGSDDIVSPGAFTYIMKQDVEHVASMDLFYWAEGRLVYSHGYQNSRKGEPMAVGRCLKRSLLDRIGWKMWNRKMLRYIDKPAYLAVLSGRPTHHYYSLLKTKNLIIDIKTSENMTKFSMRLNYAETMIDIEDHFSPEVCKMLKEL